MINLNNKIFYQAIIPDNCKKKFIPNTVLSLEDKEKCFDFAYQMAFGENHNPYSFRSKNPKHIRNQIEIFRDAFQGKLAETGFYNLYSKRKDYNIPPPDFSVWKRGKWEDTDFEATVNHKKYKISIKSTKDFGQLLLLEKNRYDKNGYYLEGSNGKKIKHDLIFLARVKGADNFIDYKNIEITPKKNLFDLLEVEITGYITYKDFLKIIKADRFIPKGVKIGKHFLKVDNYYAFASELKLKEYKK